jgi:hypothetical protein
MINTKVKLFEAYRSDSLERQLNEFLSTIDVRQIIKNDYSVAGAENANWKFTAIIYYVELSDIRDAKIDNVLSL